MDFDQVPPTATTPGPHAAKMGAVARVAGGLSHDVGDLVDLAAATIREAMATASTTESTRHRLEEASASLSRASLITRQLESLARSAPSRPEPRAIGRTVADLLPLAERLAGPAVTIDATGIDPDAWATTDPGQVEQIIFHLVVNARDALPDGGEIGISVRHNELDAKRTHRFGTIAPGRWVTIEVRDSGEGMSEEVLSRLFEPFFTTKPPGRGSGLGLATVWGIAHQLGGQVSVQSSPGNGAEVTVWLPSGTPKEVLARGGAAGVGVLVVDDDEWVRAVTARSLRRAGYGVLEAGDAAEALDVLADVAGGCVEVVLADIGMPGMSGRALADEIAVRFPATRVVLMTGQMTDPTTAVRDSRPVLLKPFSRQELLAAVAGTA